MNKTLTDERCMQIVHEICQAESRDYYKFGEKRVLLLCRAIEREVLAAQQPESRRSENPTGIGCDTPPEELERILAQAERRAGVKSAREALQYALKRLSEPPFGGVVDCTPVLQALANIGGCELPVAETTVFTVPAGVKINAVTTGHAEANHENGSIRITGAPPAQVATRQGLTDEQRDAISSAINACIKTGWTDPARVLRALLEGAKQT